MKLPARMVPVVTMWLCFTRYLFYALPAKPLGHAHNVSDKAVMAAFHVLREEGGDHEIRRVARLLQTFVRERWQALEHRKC